MLVTNIEWNVDHRDAVDYAFDMEKEHEILLKIGHTEDYISKMSETDIRESIMNALRHNRITVEEIEGLPSEMELPGEDWARDDVYEYLEDHYGCFVKDFTMGEEIER